MLHLKKHFFNPLLRVKPLPNIRTFHQGDKNINEDFLKYKEEKDILFSHIDKMISMNQTIYEYLIDWKDKENTKILRKQIEKEIELREEARKIRFLYDFDDKDEYPVKDD